MTEIFVTSTCFCSWNFVSIQTVFIISYYEDLSLFNYDHLYCNIIIYLDRGFRSKVLKNLIDIKM